MALAQRNAELVKLTDYVHFQEDAMRQSAKYPIFVVADGVTLEFGQDGDYPIPSGASEVAHIFCEKIVEEAEKLYDNFSKKDINAVFVKANEAVGAFNLKQGRTKDKINFWDFDLFAATGALLLLKDEKLYWASICDSFAAQFDKQGKIKFQSPPCWTAMRARMEKNPANLSEEEKRIMVRRVYRNGIDDKGNLIGYGVITGEEAAMKYLNSGRLKIKTGDLLALFTDGFEEYLKLPEFINLFKEWPDNLEEKLQKFTAEKSKEDPEKFGHERTLIVIKYN